MLEDSAAAYPKSYPAYVGAEPSMAFAAHYNWGSLQITHDAVAAYGLRLNPLTEISPVVARQSQNPRAREFRADFIVAGPEEVFHDGPVRSLLLGYVAHKRGARITLGINQDRDLAGLTMTSHLIDGLATNVPESERPNFLKQHGPWIQDHVKEQLPILLADGFAHMTGQMVQKSYESWAERYSHRAATRTISRVSTLAVLGAGSLNTVDLVHDGKAESVTVLVTMGYLGWLALHSNNQVKRTLSMAPLIKQAGQTLAANLSEAAHDDVYKLLHANSGPR